MVRSVGERRDGLEKKKEEESQHGRGSGGEAASGRRMKTHPGMFRPPYSSSAAPAVAGLRQSNCSKVPS